MIVRLKNVSWNDVKEFIKRLNQNDKTGIFRLPTEAEWERACRAGAETAFANGKISELECKKDPNLNQMGWYCGNSGVNLLLCRMSGMAATSGYASSAWDFKTIMIIQKLTGMFGMQVFANPTYAKGQKLSKY